MSRVRACKYIAFFFFAKQILEFRLKYLNNDLGNTSKSDCICSDSKNGASNNCFEQCPIPDDVHCYTKEILRVAV